MANPFRQAVNQRLYFSHLHLDWLQELLQRQQITKTVVEQALGESILLHLMMAYRCYLKELASAYQMSATTPMSAAELGELLQTQQRQSAECDELIALEQGDNWLSRLLKAYRKLGEEIPGGGCAASHSGDSISIHHIDAQTVSPDMLASIYQSMHELITRQRNHLEEW